MSLHPTSSTTSTGGISHAQSTFSANTCALHLGDSPIMEGYLKGHKHTHTQSVQSKTPDDDQRFTISKKGNDYAGTSKIGMALSYQETERLC